MGRKLSQKDLENFRALLLHLRAEIADDIDDLAADAFSGEAGRLSVDNPADTGSDSFAQEFSLELLQRDETTLGEITEALDRIEDGSFGRCEGCNDWIPKTRLNAMPYARNCVSCQREAERA